ncbi:MAG: Uma2 family endonuclease [Bacteroidetes bacterium]|nr:Uma2 family endonuclease [Bacteroidota bacterium]
MLKDDVFTEEIQTFEPDYETERNKPMPNKLHGILQHFIGFLLEQGYGNLYDFPTEVSLATEPGTTPDICIYPRSEKFDWSKMQAKETEMPITTIEILSPSQSLEAMALKIRKQYFPNGVKSAWIVVPAFKAIHVLLPDSNLYFSSGNLVDPATGIEISVDKVFERVV